MTLLNGMGVTGKIASKVQAIVCVGILIHTVYTSPNSTCTPIELEPL